jgi:hypothetical protein
LAEGTDLLKNWDYFHHRRRPGHDDCIESRWYNRYDDDDDDVIVMRWLCGLNMFGELLLHARGDRGVF